MSHISLANTVRCQTALDAVLPPRAWAKHLTVDDLVSVAERVTARAVPLVTSKTGLIGTQIIVRGAVSDSKRWGVRATRAVIELRASGWRLTEVARGMVFPGQYGVDVLLPRQADTARIERRLAGH